MVLDESREVLRAERGVLICGHPPRVRLRERRRRRLERARRGTRGACCRATPTARPGGSAARLASSPACSPAVVITDSFGRAWRHGQCDVAIGCAGLAPLEDWRGRADAHGRELRATWIAIADELAAAADLARGKDAFEPVVLVRGAARHVSAEDAARARRRWSGPRPEDLFR